MEPTLFEPPATRLAAVGEPTGPRTRNNQAKPATWQPYRVTARMPCMRCIRDQVDGHTTTGARQARWRLDLPGHRPLLLCGPHKQDTGSSTRP